MGHATDVVGYAYEADVHCVDCTVKAFDGREKPWIDQKGIEVGAIFDGEDAYEECRCCDGYGTHDIPCKSADRGCVNCEDCEGTGKVPLKCGDCGEELAG